MRLLKVVEEYRAESEQEVKEMNEHFKNEAKSEGYILNAFSYTKKEKKKSGEIIDDGYLVKVAKVYGGFWDGLE
jgi:hypothetical protein